MKKVFCVFTVLILTAVLISGCARQEQSSETEGSELSEDTEALSCTYSSVDELISHIKQASETTDAAEESVELGTITHFYAPDISSFPDYRLFQIEVLSDYIIYYLTPSEKKTESFSYDTGITVTYCRNADVTLAALAAQSGLQISDDGFLYDQDRGDISFEINSAVMTVHVPNSLNDYEQLKAFCSAEKIVIE